MRFGSLLSAVALAALTGACSEGQVATELPTGAEGGAVLLGTVVRTDPGADASVAGTAGAGITVRVLGTQLVTSTDEAGRFALTGLRDGTAKLRLQEGTAAADVSVPGLASGQTVTVRLRLSGSQATLQF